MGTLEKFHSPSHLQQIKIYLLYTLMIIDFEHSFKNYHEILDFYGIWEYHCPKCGATHSFHRHAVYSRNLIVWESDGLVEKQMKILRLQCKSCSSTHAVLTPDIIPFFIYSLEAFLALITMCLDTEISVLKTEKETGTSYQLLYQFLRIFHSYRKRLLLFFRRESLWSSATHPFVREFLQLLHLYPPRWLSSHFFIQFQIPLFLHRHNTVSYPLLFGSSSV